MNHNPLFQKFIQENIKIECESEVLEKNLRSALSELLRDESSQSEFELFGTSGFTSLFRYHIVIADNSIIDVLITNNTGKQVVGFIVNSELYIDEVRDKINSLFKKKVSLYCPDKISKLMKNMELFSIELKLEMVLRREKKFNNQLKYVMCLD
jgi:hypothetical protein